MLRSNVKNTIVKYLQILVALIIVAITWVAAHYIKNSYLGEYVDYERHRIATTSINFYLMIATIVFIKCYWKEFAFTLVELAIVLIIIGFVIAGISGGTSLVQSARLNSVIIEAREKQAAILNFRSRYNALPGDFAGAFAALGSQCGTNDVGGANSCNGNGNNVIDSSALLANPIEDLKFWSHLSLSGMLQGSFTGQTTSTRQSAGINVPNSALGRNSGYSIENWGFYGQTYQNFIQLAGWMSGQAKYKDGAMNAQEAYSVDTKMDDGNPYTGKVLGVRAASLIGSSVCVTGIDTSTTPVQFIFTDTANNCRLIFLSIDTIN